MFTQIHCSATYPTRDFCREELAILRPLFKHVKAKTDPSSQRHVLIEPAFWARTALDSQHRPSAAESTSWLLEQTLQDSGGIQNADAVASLGTTPAASSSSLYHCVGTDDPCNCVTLILDATSAPRDLIGVAFQIWSASSPEAQRHSPRGFAVHSSYATHFPILLSRDLALCGEGAKRRRIPLGLLPVISVSKGRCLNPVATPRINSCLFSQMSQPGFETFPWALSFETVCLSLKLPFLHDRKHRRRKFATRQGYA
jgi:hypothetical protein